MPARRRMPTALEAIYKVKVKNLRDDNYKIVALRADVYERQKKEFQMEVLETIKPEGITWQAYQKKLEEAKEQIAAGKQNEIDPIVIPEPPAQNKERLPGEAQGQFHARRMKEGKAYKKWEKEYGEAYARRRSPEPVEESEATRRMFSGQGEEDGLTPAGEIGDEATGVGEAVDPVKEALEAQAMAELEARNQ